MTNSMTQQAGHVVHRAAHNTPHNTSVHTPTLSLHIRGTFMYNIKIGTIAYFYSMST